MDERILLVDDHSIVREGLNALVAAATEFQVVGEAANAREALELAQTLQPDIVIMDIGLPDMSGIEATRQLMKLSPPPKVLALSIYVDQHYVRGMLMAGAKGYLPKNCAAEELLTALRALSAGTSYINEQIQGELVDDYVRQMQGGATALVSCLTEREREILCLLARGLNAKEIAAKLQLSPKTVEAHRGHIMGKLNFHSLADLTRFAIREGLVPLNP